MARPSQLPSRISPIIIDPTEGASHVGYREIAGNIPSTGEGVTLKTWVLVFELPPQAEYHYLLIRDLLDSVTGQGLAAVRLSGIQSDRHGSMSERIDLLGSVSTIWVTAVVDDDTARGAIPVAVNDIAVHILAVSPYDAEGRDRAVYMLERIAQNMQTRLGDLRLPPWSDTMSRLPILGDVGGNLLNTSVGVNTYTVRR